MSRKRGKKIKHTLAVKPLNVKSNKFEFQVRASLVALINDQANEDHLVNLYVLADMAHRINAGRESHVETHVAAVRRLCDEIFAAEYHCSGMQYTAMEASCDVLVRYLLRSGNSAIAHHAVEAMRQVERMVG